MELRSLGARLALHPVPLSPSGRSPNTHRDPTGGGKGRVREVDRAPCSSDSSLLASPPLGRRTEGTTHPSHVPSPFTTETPFTAGSFLPPSLGCLCASCLESPSRNLACQILLILQGPSQMSLPLGSHLGPPARNQGLPWWLSCKASACNAGATGDLGSIPGWGRSPGGGHGSPPKYSCLENPHGQRSLVGYDPWDCKEPGTTEAT